MRKALGWFGGAVSLIVAFLVIAFGLLQTRPGKDFLAAEISRMASTPGSVWAIDGLGGTVPFRMTARRITLSDTVGRWLILHEVRLDLGPADLLSGVLHVRLARAAEIDQSRPPSGPSKPLDERLRVPHLPVSLVVDKLVIDRLALAAPILGEAVDATVSGGVAVTGGTAQAALDIHRIDTSPGQITLQMDLAGVEPRLRLQLKASEPTGVLLARALGRSDRLPLGLSLEGEGPVSDWHGRLTASAGAQARLDADLTLAVSTETAVGLAARADLAPLLPPDLAPLVGDHAKLSLHATFGDRIVFDRLSLATAAGTATGDAAFGGPGEAVAAHLHTELPDLSELAGITGEALSGSAAVNADLSGSKRRPVAKADFSAAGVKVFGAAAESIKAQLSAVPTGDLDNRRTRIAVDAHGQLAGLILPGNAAVVSRFAQGVGWSLAATVNRDARAVELTAFDLHGGGVDLSGAGHLAAAARGVVGDMHFTGAANGLRTGVAAADALLGGTPTLTGAIRRDEAGLVSLDDLALTGAGAKLTGNARFDQSLRGVTATLSVEIPRLEPLRPALGTGLAGAVSARLKAEGPLDRLRLQAQIDGRQLAAGGASIDRVRLEGDVADLSQPKAAIDGSFRARGLDGRLLLTAAPIGDTGLDVGNLKLTAADSTISGNLRVAFGGGLVQGSLTEHLPDLSRWSGLAGRPLGGGLEVNAKLAAVGGGQGLDLTVNGTRLAVGTGSARAEIGHLAVTARLANLWRSPSGMGRLALSMVHSNALDFTTAAATFDSHGPGRFSFQGNADGRPLSMALAGQVGLTTGAAELRLSRLTGVLGSEHFALEQPLDFQHRGRDLAFSHLALRFGQGRIAGAGSVRSDELAFTLNASNLPIAAVARLVGHPEMHGDLSLAATLDGSLRSPQGRFSLNAAGLSLAVSQEARTPRLGLTVEGDWNGRAVDLKGEVTGLHGDRMAFTGSLPMLLSPAPIAISMPRQGRLAFSLQGSGDIARLADLLPLGEDRLKGQFAADLSVSGTVAAPSASGRLQLTNAGYENLASGAVLKDLSADLVGNGDRFRLETLSANDGAGGSLKAQGSLALGGTEGPSAQLSAALANFRVAARDEGSATASGTVSVTGPLAALKITAPLIIDRASVNLPNSLPPSVVVLKVTEVNGSKQPASQRQAAAPTLPATLDIALRLSGPVLVQGHGLDSQWGGRLKITGTAAAPKVAGSLVANRGSYALLGKSFRLTRGTITFDGTSRIDPALDIVAEASAADITADVTIAGLASAPTVTLSSTPPLPRDEILARLLFGTGVRQMTAGQGLELAEAAAAFSGGGPGMLDRLRGGLGLDWLRLGQGPAGAASSILNPSVVTPTTTSTTAVSAGKYIAPGVSVGVTQGVSPPTSKVTVEVDVGHHVTVDTEAGQNFGTGIGLNYNYDY
jgi:translocation and assembly module TamB